MSEPRELLVNVREIVTGISARDLHMLLMVAAYEARECPKETPNRIARTLMARVCGLEKWAPNGR